MELIRAKKSKLSIDLAPLIDVVFQLLVFFMLTSTFANPSIKLDLPRAINGDVAAIEYITVSIDVEGNVYVNDTRTVYENLVGDLQDTLSKSEHKSVHIKGDQNMPYKHFVQVMELAKQAGALHINVVHQKNAVE